MQLKPASWIALPAPNMQTSLVDSREVVSLLRQLTFQETLKNILQYYTELWLE